MKASRIFLSDLAVADVLAQADWYQFQAGPELAKRWERAVTSAFTQIIRRPGAGSPCSFKASELRGVRRVSIRGFPRHSIFYQFQ